MTSFGIQGFQDRGLLMTPSILVSGYKRFRETRVLNSSTTSIGRSIDYRTTDYSMHSLKSTGIVTEVLVSFQEVLQNK